MSLDPLSIHFSQFPQEGGRCGTTTGFTLIQIGQCCVHNTYLHLFIYCTALIIYDMLYL